MTKTRLPLTRWHQHFDRGTTRRDRGTKRRDCGTKRRDCGTKCRDCGTKRLGCGTSSSTPYSSLSQASRLNIGGSHTNAMTVAPALLFRILAGSLHVPNCWGHPRDAAFLRGGLSRKAACLHGSLHARQLTHTRASSQGSLPTRASPEGQLTYTGASAGASTRDSLPYTRFALNCTSVSRLTQEEDPRGGLHERWHCWKGVGGLLTSFHACGGSGSGLPRAHIKAAGKDGGRGGGSGRASGSGGQAAGRAGRDEWTVGRLGPAQWIAAAAAPDESSAVEALGLLACA